MTEATGLEAKTIHRLPSVGAANLNLALQEALNPPEQDIFMRGRGKVTMPKECLRRSGYAYRTDDKVMQIKNIGYEDLQLQVFVS